MQLQISLFDSGFTLLLIELALGTLNDITSTRTSHGSTEYMSYKNWAYKCIEAQNKDVPAINKTEKKQGRWNEG